MDRIGKNKWNGLRAGVDWWDTQIHMPAFSSKLCVFAYRIICYLSIKKTQKENESNVFSFCERAISLSLTHSRLLAQIEINDFKFCFCLRKSICVVHVLVASSILQGFVFLYFILFHFFFGGNINRVFDFCNCDSLPFVVLP